jgi:hypothetical protein
MQRAPRFVFVLLLGAFLIAPAAADETAAEAPGGAGPARAASPWEHPLWHNATAMMRLYLCEHARRPPRWCGESQELPADSELPEPLGPPLHEEDARWLAFLEQVDPADLSAEDLATIRRRATQRRDPQAMEILGFLHAEGVAVARDYAEAYRWYGLAYLAGERRVKPNMDIVWQQLQRHDLEGALALTREFDALAAGEAPESLAPALPQAAEGAPAAAASGGTGQ